MNYNVYRFSVAEKIRYVIIFIIFAILIAYLFYDSLWAALFICPFYIPYINAVKSKSVKQRKKKLLQEFRDMSESLMAALSSGYSIENSFREANKDMEKLHGKDSLICKELKMTIYKIDNGVTLEHCLRDFSERANTEDISDFTEVFTEAKRMGGNYGKLISRIITVMREKEETENEIETMLSGKHLEQRVISIIPMIILLYLRVSTGSFMNVLYKNTLGIVTMSVCLILYVMSYLLSEKISNIEV